MTSLRWLPVDDDTADLLALVADEHRIPGADVPALFLAACKRDADAHGGLVSVNRVRALLADADIPPRRYSALWAHFTGIGKPMVKAIRPDLEPVWETCKGSTSGNDGRPFQLRRWVGAA
jgi:hypothetical protein